MRPPFSLETPGTFGLGCNYWASHAGTRMWSDWRPEVIADDFAKLAAHGIEWLRIFPLWPDFQPIMRLRGGAGETVEFRIGELPLPEDAIGQAGVSVEMLQRLTTLCSLAEKAGLKLIVGLVTGWMSGRLFIPPALEGLDPITDATSLSWQIKLVRALVGHARDQRAVVAWDLGNECNCMGRAPNRDAAYLWTAAIAQTIRATDPSRPVVSGMHSLTASVGGIGNPWLIDDQADLTDILTTHPYPYWTRHTRADAVTGLRTTLHATAETRFYADIGGKPCIAEEIGTMGPMVAGDHESAAFARVNLFSLWANDCRAFLWWCAHDQTHLTHAPYDWNGVELELGLLRVDGTAKPVLTEMKQFADFLRTLPFDRLPRRAIEGVCLLTHNQDDWAAAYGSFVLAKQARLEIEFRHIQQPLPDSGLYLLPSLKGPNCVPRRKWVELLARVRAGATLYLSLEDGIVPHFNEIAGVELLTRAQPCEPLTAVWNDEPDTRLTLAGGDDLRFRENGAEILARRADNRNPAFWKHRYGQGLVYVMVAPIEVQLTLRPGAVDGAAAQPFWRIYRELTASRPTRRWLRTDAPVVAITEHEQSDDHRIVIAINHSGVTRTLSAAVAHQVRIDQVHHGVVESPAPGTIEITLPAHDAAVFAIARA